MNWFIENIIHPVLRTYQDDLSKRGRKTCTIVPKPVRVIFQASTGSGKSIIALELMLCCYEKSKTSLFIVSGRTLVNQFEGYLQKAGAPYGVIMAGRGRNDAPIQIASKETLAARSIRRQRQELPKADLVIIDEAHESMATEWVKLLDHYKDSIVIGLTATPALGNGKGLGKVWNGMEMAVTTKQLVAESWLVPCRVFAPEKPNLHGVKIDKNGDYNQIQLADRMDRPKITGNVVTNWKKHGEGRKTVVFGCTIDHAKHMCDEFNTAGIRFRHVDQETPDDEREEIFGEIADGKVMGFTNVSVARRGLDLPCLECACVVRPTRSLVLWLQMIGRIRRPSPGKTDCVIIDHAGACDNHCMPDEEIPWDLDAKKKIGDWLQRQKDTGKIPKQFICPQCSCMFTGNRCPNCGYMLKEKPKSTREVHHADGILVERNGKTESHSFEDMEREWQRIIAICVNKKIILGTSVHMFSKKFGKLPWEVRGMKNLPPAGQVWKQKAHEVFPQFLRVKVK